MELASSCGRLPNSYWILGVTKFQYFFLLFCRHTRCSSSSHVQCTRPSLMHPRVLTLRQVHWTRWTGWWWLELGWHNTVYIIYIYTYDWYDNINRIYIPRTFLSFVFRGRFKSIATCWKDCLLGGRTVFWKRPVFLHLNLHMRVPYYMESSHHIGSIGIVPLDSSFMELHSLPPI